MSPPTTRIRVCHIDDVAAGSILKVEQNGLVLAIFNVDGEFYATDNACTHGPGELSEGELYGFVLAPRGVTFDFASVSRPRDLYPLFAGYREEARESREGAWRR